MRHWMLVSVGLSVVAPMAPVQAQRPISVGLAGGVAIPQGELRDGVKTGWHGLATIALNTPMQPLGLRLDLAYNRFTFSDQARNAFGGSGNETVSSGTLNATYRLPMTNSPMSPYLISGLGAYHTACSLGSGCEGVTRYGWNVGLGAKFYALRLRSFLEARYHRTAGAGSDVHYFPVTIGIML